MMNTMFTKTYKNPCELQYIMQTVQILTRWLHYFTFCLTLSMSNPKETLNTLIKSIVGKRPTGVNIGVVLPTTQPPAAASKNSTPSQTTPTFRSPHSSFSFSDGVKNQSAAGLSKLKTQLVGAEEYETYDEDIANLFFANVFSTDFHNKIFHFVNESQKSQSNYGQLKEDYTSIFQNENEAILLNLLEILMILNDIK